MEKRFVYADNSATTRVSQKALDAALPYFTELYGNPSSIYSLGMECAKAVLKAREQVANALGAKVNEIYFTAGGSESDNWAIRGCAQLGEKKGKKHIITTAFEHHAVLHTCEAVERLGYPVTYMFPDDKGIIMPETLSSFITNETLLVSIMYANNELGTIQPICELCDIAHSRNALFHTDAVQAVGHVEIDVKKLGVDMLSASAHKFNGPKGIGFLYARNGVKLLPYADGGAQEHGLRAGTENIASIVGMAIALKNNIESLHSNQEHIVNLEKLLLKRMDECGLPYVRNGGGSILPGVVSLSFDGKNGEAILHRMDLMGISISTGSACDSKITDISHVLKAIHLPDNLAKGTVRISLGKNNTEEDIEAIVTALRKIVL